MKNKEVEVKQNLDDINALFSSMRQITRNLGDLFSIIAEKSNFTVLQLMIILSLGSEENGESSIGSLGDLVGVTGGNISNITKKIESLGYIKRERSKKDERVVNVRLTENGVDICKRVVVFLNNIGMKIENKLGIEEKENFMKDLNTLNKYLTLSVYIGKGKMEEF